MANESKRAVLVYQAGIANVFAVDRLTKSTWGRNARQLYQHAFTECECFADGLAAAGWRVCVAYCNRAGDIRGDAWDTAREHAPFSESFRRSNRYYRAGRLVR